MKSINLKILIRIIIVLEMLTFTIFISNLFGDDELTLIQQGKNAFKEQKYGLAIEFFNKAALTDPNNEDIFYLRGSAYAHLSEKNKNPSDLDYAIADDDRAIKLNPKDARALSNRGLAYIYKKDFSKATKDLTASIKLDPNSSSAYINLGLNYVKSSGDIKAAIDEYSRAISIDPNDAQAYALRADSLLSMQYLDKSMEDATNAIRLDPTNREALYTRAMVYYEKKDESKSLQDYESMIQLDPNDSIAYSYAAWILATSPMASLRNGKLAVSYAIKGCELSGWKNSKKLEILASAYAEAGDFSKAIYWENIYLKSFGLSPQMIESSKKRLMLYEAHKAYHRGN